MQERCACNPGGEYKKTACDGVKIDLAKIETYRGDMKTEELHMA